jgi:hypothetical protein
LSTIIQKHNILLFVWNICVEFIFGGCDGGGDQSCGPRIGDEHDATNFAMTVDTTYQFEIIFDNENKNASFTIKSSGGTLLRSFSANTPNTLNDLIYFGALAGRESDGQLTCIDNLIISKYEGNNSNIYIYFNRSIR